jgi:hypothetical protein
MLLHPAVSPWLREKYETVLKKERYSTFVLSITDRCNIRCDFCCHPYMDSQFDAADAERLVEEACGQDFDEICLTGGEPFLRRSLLLSLARRARVGDMMFGAITNAYWAKSPDAARCVAAELAEAGVARVTVSWDPSHGEFVSAEKAQWAVDALMAAGLRVSLVGSFKQAGETHADHGFDLTAHTPYANFRVVTHSVSPAGEGAALELDRWDRPPLGERAAKGDPIHCPSRSVEELVLYSDGGLTQPCCSIYAGYKAPALSLGDWRAHSVADLKRLWQGDGFFTLVREGGFVGLYDVVRERDPALAERLPDFATMHDSCELCAAIMASPEGPAVRRVASEHVLDEALTRAAELGLVG